MAANEIKIVYEAGVPLVCTVWDAAGGPHDITDIVQQITDRTTKTLGTTELVLRHGQNSLSATVKFTSSKKETVFEVAPAVIQQILQMKA